MFEGSNYKIDVFKSRQLDTNCYLISTPKGNVVIDPCVDYKTLSKYGEITTVLITHGHFDHFEKLETFLNKRISFGMHYKCLEKIRDSKKNLSSDFGKPISFNLRDETVVMLANRDLIEVHDMRIMVMSTRGHSDCSLTYILDDFIFTGDFIFKGSIGRTDFYSSNTSIMINSITNFLSYFREDKVLLPGHGEDTTLIHERRTNYYLKKYANGGDYEFFQY